MRAAIQGSRKEQSILDVALNYDIHSTTRARQLRLHDLPRLGKRRCESDFRDGRRGSRQARHGRDLQLNSRLGCQAVIKKPGKVVVEIPAWNRNYVSEEH